MKRCWVVIAAVVVGAVWLAGPLRAQPPVPGGPGPAVRPPYSPYLNLLRGGSPTLNYYGLVRPEQQFRRSIQQLQGAAAENRQAIVGLHSEVTGLPTTGHPTQFLNYGGYFLNSGFAPTTAGAAPRTAGQMGSLGRAGSGQPRMGAGR